MGRAAQFGDGGGSSNQISILGPHWFKHWRQILLGNIVLGSSKGHKRDVAHPCYKYIAFFMYRYWQKKLLKVPLCNKIRTLLKILLNWTLKIWIPNISIQMAIVRKFPTIFSKLSKLYLALHPIYNKNILIFENPFLVRQLICNSYSSSEWV